MIDILQEKLETLKKLKNYTKEILLLSPKNDFLEINRMIENRKEYEKILNLVDVKLNELKSSGRYSEDSLIIKDMKESIVEEVREVIKLDKEIRKKISFELKETKENLNQPEKTLKLNVKA